MRLSPLKANLLFILVLILLCIGFYNYQFFQLPYGVHEWSNAERFALAAGFFDNGMNFFLPSTYNQYSINGISGHEFPIQSYLAAVLAKLFGRDSISMCFRLIDIIMFGIGLCSLFALVYKRIRIFVVALIAPMMLIASPMLVDYAGGYLPDPFSSSLVFVSFYFLADYFDNDGAVSFNKSVFFLTLATLVKTSSVIYLAGFLLYVLFNLVAQRKTKTIKEIVFFFLTACCSVLPIAVYYFYNAYLNEKYQSGLFLAKAVPFENLDDVGNYFSRSFQHHWIDHYFVLPAYLFLIALIASATALYKRSAQYRRQLRLAGLFLLFLLPVFGSMGHQLHVHDYYVLCIFFPFIIWMVLLSVLVLFNGIEESIYLPACKRGLWAALILLYCFSDFSTYKRLDPNDPEESYYSKVKWMQNGASILAGLKIPMTEHILVLNEHAPNRGLVYFDRKGYQFWDNLNGDQIESFMKERHLRIAVCETKIIEEREHAEPGTFARFTKIYRDEQATVLLFQSEK
jgi:hypothetical protein